MTDLAKTVKRKTRHEYRVMTHKPRKIIVLLMPGDVLGFKEVRCRQTFTLPIDEAFKIAVRKAAKAENLQRKKRL